MKKINKVIEQKIETNFDLRGIQLDIPEEPLRICDVIDCTNKEFIEKSKKLGCTVELLALLQYLCWEINSNNKQINYDIRELGELVLEDSE